MLFIAPDWDKKDFIEFHVVFWFPIIIKTQLKTSYTASGGIVNDLIYRKFYGFIC